MASTDHHMHLQGHRANLPLAWLLPLPPPRSQRQSRRPARGHAHRSEPLNTQSHSAGQAPQHGRSAGSRLWGFRNNDTRFHFHFHFSSRPFPKHWIEAAQPTSTINLYRRNYLHRANKPTTATTPSSEPLISCLQFHIAARTAA